MKTREQAIAAFKTVDIYPVISSEFTNERPVTDVLRMIGDGGAKIVQLREKNMHKAAIFALAEQYRNITGAYGMLLIINDHIDVALACDADGVHLGQDDLPIEAAKRIAGRLIVGCSTHNAAEVAAAAAAGADYINIGPLFPTGTKSLPFPPLGLGGLETLSAMTDIPFTVMGGIKERHIPELRRLGAQRIAMVTEITQAPDITAAVKNLRGYWEWHGPSF